MAPQLSEDEIDDLLYAARTGEKDELTTLLSSLSEREKVSPAEILISARDEGKSTCLHMATGNGHADIVTYLLSHFTSRSKEEKQAFLDAPNEYGNTGLHWAALGGHLPVVKLLVENGASVALANDKNYVPLDLASFGDKFDVVDYFLARSSGLEEENAASGDGLKNAVEGVQLEEEGLQAGEEEDKGKSKGKEEGSS
ncbi:ankyrin repeat-containing domain protein [Achaetomium macrosporum]|uniref:Ankyrin repeat-containing domain protein n=1 Tax=Achaetomium macrosporum TaxID=79813 RepID=A0AAN7HCF4_9PEZI|nr:ankyrin repeat-containing domain protein [Achaetomium macrosporum]